MRYTSLPPFIWGDGTFSGQQRGREVRGGGAGRRCSSIRLHKQEAVALTVISRRAAADGAMTTAHEESMSTDKRVVSFAPAQRQAGNERVKRCLCPTHAVGCRMLFSACNRSDVFPIYPRVHHASSFGIFSISAFLASTPSVVPLPSPPLPLLCTALAMSWLGPGGLAGKSPRPNSAPIPWAES